MSLCVNNFSFFCSAARDTFCRTTNTYNLFSSQINTFFSLKKNRKFPTVLFLEQLVLKLIASHVREKPVSAALAGFLSPETATNKKRSALYIDPKKGNKRKTKNQNKKHKQLERQRQEKSSISMYILIYKFYSDNKLRDSVDNSQMSVERSFNRLGIS